MSTIAIVGAGPGLGLSIAKAFGRNGFSVALVSRSQEGWPITPLQNAANT